MTRPTQDESAGIDWWNGLAEPERAHWLRAAQTATPAVAWAHYKRQQLDLHTAEEAL